MLDPKLGSHHKDQLLTVLFHYMGQDLRQKLMVECSAAYNAACGRDVVRVVRCDDGTSVIQGEFRVTRVVLGDRSLEPAMERVHLPTL